MKGAVPEPEVHKHNKVRPGIMAAAMGIKSLDEPGNILSASSDSLYTEDVEKKLEDGLKRANKMKAKAPETESHKVTKQRHSIMAAATGIKSLDDHTLVAGSSDSLYTDDVEKKLQDGMKRANKMKGIITEAEPHKTSKPRHTIMAAATGLKTLDDQNTLAASSDSLYSDDVQQKLEEGIKRAQKMRGIAPESESHKPAKHRHGIMAAATGIKALEDPNSLGASSDSLEYDEAERKAAEGMKRANQMKGAVPESESHKHVKTRRGIRAVAAGIKNLDDPSSLSGSSDSLNSDSLERKLDDGMKRANQMKSAMPESDTHKTAHVRPGIMAAAIGLKPLNDPLGLTRSSSASLDDDLDKRGEDAILRTKNMKGAEKEHHSRSHVRAGVFTAAATSLSTSKTGEADETETSQVGELEKMESFSKSKPGQQRRESFASSKKQSFTEGQTRTPRRGSIFQSAIGSGQII